MAPAALTTVRAVLSRFGNGMPAFTTAFLDGQYVLWLGSGISRDRVPNVYELLGRVVEFLRSRIDLDDEHCFYRSALDDVLALASLTEVERGSLDYGIPFAEWSSRDRIAGVLVARYSEVLDVRVRGKARDFLVWEALDVPETYGSPSIEPDVEHYCIAVLMLEGLVDSAVTANWDGLVERALTELSSSVTDVARFVVKPEDFQLPTRPIDFIKFHGCAVRARSDSNYRPLLIARHSQISVWATQQHHRSMRRRLEALYAERPTLMLGLSAQDANLHHVFGTAVQDLARGWSESAAPAIVLSEQRLLSHHSHVLEITYGEDFEGNVDAITESAVIGAFGKPSLIALVLEALTRKLSFLVSEAMVTQWGDEESERLAAELLHLRDRVADFADPPNAEDMTWEEIVRYQRDFVARLIHHVNVSLSIFRTGLLPAHGQHYEPLSDRPIARAILNPDFPGAQFGLFGVALALMGRGHAAGDWSVETNRERGLSLGLFQLATSARTVPIHIVKDSSALAALELSDGFDTNDGRALIVVADEEAPESTRSPRPRYGRVGRSGPGRFSVASNVGATSSADELLEAFKLAGGL